MESKERGVNPADESKKKFLEWVAHFFSLFNLGPSRKEKLKTDHYNMHTVDKDPAKLMCDNQDFVRVLCFKWNCAEFEKKKTYGTAFSLKKIFELCPFFKWSASSGYLNNGDTLISIKERVTISRMILIERFSCLNIRHGSTSHLTTSGIWRWWMELV